MQKYKEYMSHIHASEELIEKTISRVKDEESKVKENKVGAEIEKETEEKVEIELETEAKIAAEAEVEIELETEAKIAAEAEVEIELETEAKIAAETEVKILAEKDVEITAEKEIEVATETKSECNNIEVSNLDEIEIKEYDEINYKKIGQSINENSPTTNLITGIQATEESTNPITENQIAMNQVTTNQIVDESQSEKKLISFKNKKRRRFIASSIGAAAAIFMAVNVSLYMNAVSYTNISLDMLRSHDTNARYKKMSLEDYEKYLGINLSTLVSDNEESIENIEVKAVMDENSVTPDLDEAVFFFSNNAESNIILRISKTKTLAPEELLNSKQSKIGKYKVYFGENEEIGKLYAGGKINGVNYFVIGSKIEKKDFEKNLKKYFDCMKPFVK